MPICAKQVWGPSDLCLQKLSYQSWLGIDFSETICVDIVTSNNLHLGVFFVFLFFFTFFFRCRNLTFPDRLPEVSIVFIFVNEALSVILRSIHSAIDRTPAHLLKEIILVDDNSSNGKRFCFCSFLPRPEVGSYMRILEFRLILIPLAFQTLSVYFLPSSSRSCWAVFKYAQVGHVKKSMFKERMLFLYV